MVVSQESLHTGCLQPSHNGFKTPDSFCLETCTPPAWSYPLTSTNLCLQSRYPLEGAAPALPAPSSPPGLVGPSKIIGAITNLCHLTKKVYVTLNNRRAEIDVKEETAVAQVGFGQLGESRRPHLHLAIITASSGGLASRLGGQLGGGPIRALTMVKDI